MVKLQQETDDNEDLIYALTMGIAYENLVAGKTYETKVLNPKNKKWYNVKVSVALARETGARSVNRPSRRLVKRTINKWEE